MTAPTPLRPGDEVVGMYVPITLAGKPYRLLELPRAANREWKAHVAAEVRKTIESVGPLDSADEVIDAIADSAELMMDLLIAYDAAGAKAWSEVRGVEIQPVLPDRDFIDTHATDRECYEAIKKVTGVAFPFGIDLLQLAPELKPLALETVSRATARVAVALAMKSTSTSSSQQSTDGSPTTSNAA